MRARYSAWTSVYVLTLGVLQSVEHFIRACGEDKYRLPRYILILGFSRCGCVCGGGVLLTYMYIYVSDYIYTIILHNIFFFSCIYLLLCKLHVLCSLVGRVIMYVVYYINEIKENKYIPDLGPLLLLLLLMLFHHHTTPHPLPS